MSKRINEPTNLLGDQLTGTKEQRCDDIGVDGKLEGMRANGHDNLFETCVPGSFADPIDGDFDLTSSVSNRCQRVGRCQSQVIVAMRGPNDLVRPPYILNQITNQARVFVGRVVAHRVGDIQRRGTRFNDGRKYQTKEVPVATA